MKKYKVIKPFFKLSEKKNYYIGDTIELTPEDAKAMNWYVVEENTKINKLVAEVSKKNIESILKNPHRK